MKKDPEGYKKLLVYKKADELHEEVLKLAEEIKKIEREQREERGAIDKILLELADQMGRASRSPLSNIAEGWKRNTTEEYFTFLGYAIASNDEIKRDCEDIIRGKYGKLMGEKGIMGEMGTNFEAVQKLPFYPFNPLNPFVVQIYLRCKELDYLFHQLQQSLENKMHDEGTLPVVKKLNSRKEQEKEADQWLENEINKLKNDSQG